MQKNDVFLIKASTVHAIGTGTLIAEIQEVSNLTYRLYDYNRLDKNGQDREIHIDKALDGCGSLFGENVLINFFKGDCIFIPADSIPLKLHDKAQVIKVCC